MSIIDSAALTQHLISGRNSDGGWGYYRGKASRLESTAWVLLALSQDRRAELSTRVLTSWPSRGGLLLEHAGGMPNYGFHGLALLALAALHLEHDAGNRTLTAGIQRVKGVQL